jgi:hypothetical protein
MLATKAEVGPAEQATYDLATDNVAKSCEDDLDDFAPARGITLGAAVGLVSIGVMGLLGWWLL